MNNVVDLHPAALAEVLKAAAEYKLVNPKVYKNFSDAMDIAVENLKLFPLGYPIFIENVHRMIIKGFPYALYYTYENQRIIVIAILKQTVSYRYILKLIRQRE